MATVTVSPKFQIVVPAASRRRLGIQPGQKMEVLVYDNRLEFIPVVSMKSARGSLRGIDTSVPRDRDRV